MSFIVVRHNIEVAHRLYELIGDKCQNIHGHSMWVEMKLHGHINTTGLLEGLNFGDVKKAFRDFLDTNFDHHLLLNNADPWATLLGLDLNGKQLHNLPGLKTTPGDPTTENITRWITKWAVETFQLNVDITVQETHVNGAGFSGRPNGK